MAGPTAGHVEHYLRMFEQLKGLPSCLQESLCWVVVRPATVEEVVLRLGGDPEATRMCRPADIGYEDDIVFVEQRGDAVVTVGFSPVGVGEEEGVQRLSRGTTLHGVFWVINNFNRLFHAVDGVVVTEFDVLRPRERWGTDPQAIEEHLGALHELYERSMSPTVRGPLPDWETAMATVETLSGVRLDAEWFRRPQTMVTVKAR